MRVLERLEQLYAIGGGPGANRPHPSPAENEAHRLAAMWLEEAGLRVEVDRDGNLFGHARGQVGSGPGPRPVWTGSHLDTVPRGGRFDGALGVVAAIEAVERVGAGSVVVFRGEEVGCIGSRALVAAGGRCPTRSSSSTSSRVRGLRTGRSARGRHRRSSATRARSSLRGTAGHAGTTPMEAATMRWSPRPSEILAIRDAARASRTPLRRSASSTSSPAPATSSRHARGSRSTFAPRTWSGSTR